MPRWGRDVSSFVTRSFIRFPDTVNSSSNICHHPNSTALGHETSGDPYDTNPELLYQACPLSGFCPVIILILTSHHLLYNLNNIMSDFFDVRLVTRFIS